MDCGSPEQVLPRAPGSRGGVSRSTYDADKGGVKGIKDLLEGLIKKLFDQHESVTIILTEIARLAKWFFSRGIILWSFL